MNPIRWLFDLSARLAERRGGQVDPRAYGYQPVDSREYEALLEIGGAALLETNLKWPERWVQLSNDAKRMARVVQAQDGLFRLSVYEVMGHYWREFEGPALFESLEEATSAGQTLLQR